MAKNAKELAEERLARIEAAIDLREPDRVPVWGFAGDMVAKYSGITMYEMCYDNEKAMKANEKFMRDFPFDTTMAGIAGLDGRVFSVAFVEFPDISPVAAFVTGPIHDILGDKYCRFPGRETSENATPQFFGGTFMEPDEYDQLIEDPVKFIAETVLPRACTNLATPRRAMATWVRLGMEFGRSGVSGFSDGMGICTAGSYR